MAADFDDLLNELAHETACTLGNLASARRVAPLNERDHLHPSCVQAARNIAQASETPLEATTSLRIISPLWPRLGRVDLAFVSGGAGPVVVELKCGAGRDALAACAWDAVKVAFVLRLGEASAAYLLAAAPRSDWAFPFRGTEFFASRRFETRALREPYLKWWRLWERDGYPAGIRVPTTFTTRAVSRVPVLVQATEWEIAVAAVHVEGEDWLDWKPTLP